MKRTVTAFILLLVIPLVYADINISEIMFNPKEGNEWVELLVSNATNISDVVKGGSEPVSKLESSHFISNKGG